jgi:MFS family permease
MSAGHITGRLGRVESLRIASSSTLIGLVFIGLANYVRVMICGRILVGFGSGLSIAVVPLHLAELPPKSLRSALGTLTQLFIVAGICLGQALSFFWDAPMLWRKVFWLAGGVALVQLLGSFFMPRATSPRQGAIAESMEAHPLLPCECIGRVLK